MKGFFSRLSDIWNIAGVIILLLVLIEVFFRIYGSFSSSEDPRVQADCYNNEEWVSAYYEEFAKCNQSEWEPYLYWKRKPFSGKYINVNENGFRASTIPQNPISGGDKDIRIFFFGGSTMWGTGVRDAYTIPSLTGAEIVKQGFNPIITNFGESGYVTTQEISQLILELRQGKIPDLVVFYDGANDIFSSYQSGESGIPQNEYNRQQEFNTLQEKKKSLWVFIQSLTTLETIQFVRHYFGPDSLLPEYAHPKPLHQLAEETVQVYNENIRLVNALAKQYDFQAIFYWQPSIFGKTHLSDYEKSEKAKVMALYELNEEVNEQLFKDQLHFENIHFYNLKDLLRDYQESLFIDWCHLGENGNIIISKQMAENIQSFSENQVQSIDPVDE